MVIESPAASLLVVRLSLSERPTSAAGSAKLAARMKEANVSK